MRHHEIHEDENELEATTEQLEILRELGVDPFTTEVMSMAEAQALIDEIQAQRDDARAGRD